MENHTNQEIIPNDPHPTFVRQIYIILLKWHTSFSIQLNDLTFFSSKRYIFFPSVHSKSCGCRLDHYEVNDYHSLTKWLGSVFFWKRVTEMMASISYNHHDFLWNSFTRPCPNIDLNRRWSYGIDD